MGNEIPDHAGDLTGVIGCAVGQVVVEITDRERAVAFDPAELGIGEGSAGYADGVIFGSERIQIVRLLRGQLCLRRVQLLQQIRTLNGNAEKII